MLFTKEIRQEKATLADARQFWFLIPLIASVFIAVYSVAFLAVYQRSEPVRQKTAYLDTFIVTRLADHVPVLRIAEDVLVTRNRTDLVVPVRNVLTVLAITVLFSMATFIATFYWALRQWAAFMIRRADRGYRIVRSDQTGIFISGAAAAIALKWLYDVFCTNDLFFRRSWQTYMSATEITLMNVLVVLILQAGIFLSVTAFFGFMRGDVRNALVRARHLRGAPGRHDPAR
jgi:hypothetical protein